MAFWAVSYSWDLGPQLFLRSEYHISQTGKSNDTKDDGKPTVPEKSFFVIFQNILGHLKLLKWCRIFSNRMIETDLPGKPSPTWMMLNAHFLQMF